MGFVFLLSVVLLVLCCASFISSESLVNQSTTRNTPATIKNVPNGKVPLTSSVFVNCPTNENAALEVIVNGETSYFSCFDLHSKSPVFTVHEIRDLSSKDLPRPDVDPWYPYNDDKSFGNGKSIIGGYDRGHLSPSADFSKTTTEMMQSTFYVMNRAAQVASFNRNSWRNLETVVRQWFEKIQADCKSCQVKILTGTTIASFGTTSEVMGVSLPIPKYYYKIVIVLDGAKSYAVLFHGDNNISLTRFPISVIGASEDVAAIPAEILQDLSNVLELHDLLLDKTKGLLRSDGKQQLVKAVPDALRRIQ